MKKGQDDLMTSWHGDMIIVDKSQSRDASASKNKRLQNLALRGCSSFHRLCEDYQNWIVGGDPNLI